MKSIEVSARTIEEAIGAGLAKLGCSLADCKVEIVQEGAKGLFGVFGSKPATVRLTPLVLDELEMESLGIDLQSALDTPEPVRAKDGSKRDKVSAAKTESSPPRKEKTKQPPKTTSASASKSQSAIERFKSAPLPGQTKPEPSSARTDNGSHQPRRVREPADKAEHAPIEAPVNIAVHDPETMEGIAQSFLLGVTRGMGVDVQIDMRRSEEGHIYATMYGDTLGILIGRRGETLDALQYLTSLQINKGRDDYTRITLDTENYRAKREDALVRLASRMANRAVKTGRKVALEPMNPYERRILHSSLQENPNVSTHSEGDEPYRHVVVVPQK
ncbi:MAG: protein jag [Clostridia bacterium]|nr:protein jag [Clostridia bacterium]